MSVVAIDRRALLGGVAAAGALTLGWRPAEAGEAAGALNEWLRIDPNGAVTIRVNCVEMGQGSQTGFAQILADELDADWTSVRVEQAPVEKPWYSPYGSYMTGGSGSIENHIDKLRALGASARGMLLAAAARRWNVAPETCLAELGRIRHPPSDRALSYGQLASSAARLAAPDPPPLKQRTQWRYIGKEMPRLDLPTKVDGSAIYGIDVALPDMLYATMAQCPQFGGALESVDGAPALAIEGVMKVVTLPKAVVVVADGFWAAKKGLEALRPRWSSGPMATTSSADISARLRELAAQDGGLPAQSDRALAARDKTRADQALAQASQRHEAVYEVPLLSQSPLEPMNATARVTAAGVDVWAPTQVQSELRSDVAKALGAPEANVTVHTTQLGGGFGRRLRTDYGVLAALTARETPGRTVKLIWTRAEDTRHGFYRPAAVARLQASLGDDGLPSAFKATLACLDTDPYGGIGVTPYDLPNAYVAAWTWNPGVPIGAFRAVDWTQNTFFLESFVDELAHRAGRDPMDYRYALLKGNPRMLRVLRAVADRSGWGAAAPGRFRGVALCERGGTLCAEVVELTPGARGAAPTLHKVTVAIDCGTAVNPGQIRAQVEGGVAFTLSAALFQRITLKNGAVEQAYFDSYPVVGMASMPPVETIVLETPEAKITGVGEPPVPPLAPALCNALFAATGERIRTLPIAPP